jgi:hypothetical protein
MKTLNLVRTVYFNTKTLRSQQNKSYQLVTKKSLNHSLILEKWLAARQEKYEFIVPKDPSMICRKMPVIGQGLVIILSS